MKEIYFWYKVGMLFGILGSSVIMCFLPFSLKNVNPPLKKRLLSFGNAFAGGVFLSIGFVHLLGEADVMVREVVTVEFPLAFVISTTGFLFVFLIEKVVFAESHHNHHHREESTAILSKGNPYGALDVDADQPPVERVTQQESGVFVYIITVVLSIHSLISGIVLGMGQNLTALVTLFVGIIGHKWIESFALGVALNKANDSLAQNWKLLVFYSATEPAGILIGVILALFLPPTALLVTQAFVLSFASGTFIYVAVMDILPSEFGTDDLRDKYKKFGVFFFGFAAVAVLVALFAHDHEHDNDHDHDHE